MKFMLRSLLVFLFVGIAGAAMAQSSGIAGKLTDDKGAPLVNAGVKVTAGGQIRNGGVTDFDGEYKISPLDAGVYDVTFSSQGVTQTITGVSVNVSAITTLNHRLQITTGHDLKTVVITGIRYQQPLIDKRAPNIGQVKTKEDFKNTGITNVSNMVSLGTQTYQAKNGGDLVLGGDRSSGTLIIVDGVQLKTGGGSFGSPPAGSIEAVKTYVSGIPARYGDATGGVVTITTSGFRSHLDGGIELRHSLDGYNNNLASFNLAGPLIKKPGDDAAAPKKTILGFALNGQFNYNKDSDPSYYKQYHANDATQHQLETNPLTTLPNSSGDPTNNYLAQTVKLSDLETHKQRDNVSNSRYALNGKLIYALGDHITVQAGAEGYMSKANNYDANNVLFNYNNNSQTDARTVRGYVRLTQRFANPTVTDSGRSNAISNAFYTVQADYSKDYATTQDKNLKHNTFDYGYIGKFQQNFAPSYGSSRDTLGVYGLHLQGYVPVGVNFTRDEVNPVLANYTSQYYTIGRGLPLQLAGGSLAAGGFLRNGDNPEAIYGRFNAAGTSSGGYNISNNDQIAITVDASFDLKYKKTTHSIEFGLYYQQRTERFYGLSAISLWQTMRQETSRVVDGSQLDLGNPTYHVNGKTYTADDVRTGIISPGPNDTVTYPLLFQQGNQNAFDRNLRKKLGVGNNVYLNTDNIDRSNYSLDMFAPDELATAGKPYVNYYGYDYTGKRVSGQVNFNDYYTARDGNGDFTRPIGAFRPNYIAGYLSDYIAFKDITLSMGVRVERYDANTKVLKDPYSFVGEQTVSDAKAKGYITNVPGSIGGGYIPYVDNNTSLVPNVIGYRNGDTWYDANGTEVSDPLTITKNAAVSNLVPLLQKDGSNKVVNITDTAFRADNSFVDYKPQVNVMPRINFSFPLNDNALFYAHYDVVVQRPTSNNFATAQDYTSLTFHPTDVINNPDLKPSKMIDYEVGLQQVVTRRSSVTISAFYKERKDQIQYRQYYQAYPTTYFTYGNRDFSTNKGFTLSYELRRVNHLKMTVNYTLAFNEGTGSDVNSSKELLNNYIGAGLPDQRNLFPLNTDSRHIISAILDYRFMEKEGPTVNGVHFLENAGANLIFRTRSGEPYTKYDQPESKVIDGAVNASRLPWHYMFDLNITKAFQVSLTKGNDAHPAKHLGLEAGLLIQNLLNTRDVLKVNGYTGSPTDNGYLTSAQGIANTNQQVDQQSYKDLYGLRSQDISYLNNPRTINFFIRMNF